MITITNNKQQIFYINKSNCDCVICSRNKGKYLVRYSGAAASSYMDRLGGWIITSRDLNDRHFFPTEEEAITLLLNNPNLPPEDEAGGNKV